MTVGFSGCLDRFGEIFKKSESECGVPSSSNFSEACDKLLASITQGGSPEGFEENFSECIRSCTIEAARMNFSAADLKENLKPVAGNMSEGFVKAYDSHFPGIRRQMKSIGWRPADVEEVNWRLLKIVQDTKNEVMSEIRAELTFQLRDEAPVRLLCNRDELQEFHWKVNEARNLLSKLPK
ncbi:hypothetical protein L596_023977 [Steinernema carpocapsae]|uniref:COMM domain-containing protein n=1 Tax=Steinernema carpocapsae TaxID=34508 RepID=A0A4U5MFC1_STECR|nr:hypothetical protein L596_023977 [Steinernema carpocapsae]